MKKAQMLTYFTWILRITFMTAVILSISILVNAYINARIDVVQLQAAVLNYRILFDNSFSYTDKFTGRTYPLIYDYETLRMLTVDDFGAKISSRLGRNSELSGAKITIHRASQELFGDSITIVERPEFVRTFYYNKQAFDRFSSLAESFVFREQALQMSRIYPLFIHQSGKLTNADMTIEVFVQK
ncbi:MAG: hypothetical protein HY363_04510 [Candidatus Aenigmarchaeota archaeon]|nr:hypothetical protein [Candidatus Aenigmarchaeota archaeon]